MREPYVFWPPMVSSYIPMTQAPDSFLRVFIDIGVSHTNPDSVPVYRAIAAGILKERNRS